MCARGHEDLMNELLALFAVEASEHLQALNQKVLELENAAPGRGEFVVGEILRYAHTLKGAAAAVSHDEVCDLTHRFEGVFQRIRDGELEADAPTLDVAYKTLDVIGGLVGAGSETGGEPDLTALIQALDALSQEGAAQEEGAARQEREAPEVPGSSPVLSPAFPGPGSASAGDDLGAPEPARARSSPPPPGPARPGPPDPPSAPSQPEGTIRVATSKLDSIMAQVGEVLVAGAGTQQNIEALRRLDEDLARWTEEWRGLRTEYRDLMVAAGSDGSDDATGLERTPDDLAGIQALLEGGEDRVKKAHAQVVGVLRSLASDTRVMARSVNGLQEEVRRARMLPVSTIFDAFPRMVRDLAREQNKKVSLIMEGADTEVDRAVLERIKSPLTHLLRNCVDHGLEAPDVRRSAGKREKGTIALEALQQGSTVLIRVSDDGRGIDVEAVVAKAVRADMIDPEAAAGLSRREALQLIFRSGLSTSPILTDVSGRGVGLDVVRENVEQLHGTVTVATEPGTRTVFSITLPLTVVTTKCLLVRVAGRRLALPISGVARTVRVVDDDIERVNGREAISVQGEPVRLARLSAVLGVADASDGPAEQMPAVVVDGLDGTVALVADELLQAQDVVVKPLPPPLGKVPGIAGASILGSGDIVPVLNAAELGRGLERAAATVTRAVAPDTEAAPIVVLLADDSITTRTLEKNILESAGYRVRAASDGLEAWMILQAEGADVAVCDVQMPRMDGFELTEKIRGDERFAELPVILVTSLDSPEDRERGVQAGADAYITKGAFDQEQLLDTIRRLS